MDKDAIMKACGFEKCDWGPEPDDQCEICAREGVQLYFQGNSYGEGTHACADCIVAIYEESEQDNEKIQVLEKAGHSSHCAARQVWGDGECECDMYGEGGYNPYAWISKIKE